MPVVAESERLSRLRALPLSPALLAMAAGRLPHPALWRCRSGDPFYLYRGAGVPGAAELIPLWDWHGWALGVRERRDGLEFLRFSVEAPDPPECLARTEPGLWARLFDALYEDDLELDELAAIAEAVAYRHWPLQLRRREDAEPRFGDGMEHSRWLQEWVAAVDALAGAD